ncbi:MAG: helicase-related protein, partial [Caldilineaceae bacterium]
MIRIIGDGRLSSIDMRFMDPKLPSNPDSKLNRMIDDVIAKFKETADAEYKDKAGKVEPNKGSTMMVFSDLGFGAGVAANRGFSARAWMEKRLRDAGIPMNQVAFMSDYKKSSAKLQLFKDVNAGRVRILVGSSKNMGTGVNAQQRLKALFHLDSPWYPADLEQREGRIIRQGNKNPLVQIYAYSTKGTYDEQMWSLLARKQHFIEQGLSGDPNVREIEDLDSESQYAMAAAMVAKDPRVLQLAGLEADIAKFDRLYQAHEDDRARFRARYREARMTVEFNEARLPEAEKMAGQAQDLSGDKFKAKVGSKTFTERATWAEALIAAYKDLSDRGETQIQQVGEISGFPIAYGGETVAGQYRTKLMLGTPSPIELVSDAGTSPIGVAMRAQNAVVDVARLPAKMRERITEARAQMDALQTRLEAPFPMLQMLSDKRAERKRLADELAAE